MIVLDKDFLVNFDNCNPDRDYSLKVSNLQLMATEENFKEVRELLDILAKIANIAKETENNFTE